MCGVCVYVVVVVGGGVHACVRVLACKMGAYVCLCVLMRALYSIDSFSYHYISQL